MENLYCTIFIVDVSQNPEEVETVSSRIQQLIEDHGGIIKRNNPWGKQKLAYPIQNKNYGFYVEIEFTANSHLNIPKTIEQEYRINDRVLRYLTYVVTKSELKQRSINAAKMKEKPEKEKPKEQETPKAKTEDVSPPPEEVAPAEEVQESEKIEAEVSAKDEEEKSESETPEPAAVEQENKEEQERQEENPDDKKE